MLVDQVEVGTMKVVFGAVVVVVTGVLIVEKVLKSELGVGVGVTTWSLRPE